MLRYTSVCLAILERLCWSAPLRKRDGTLLIPLSRRVDQSLTRKSSKFRLPGLRSPRLRWQTDAIPNGLSIAILVQDEDVRSGTNLNTRAPSAGYDVALWLAQIACMND